jgi:hypothetical protein
MKSKGGNSSSLDAMVSQTSGMTASDPIALGRYQKDGDTGDVGLPGVKYLAAYSWDPNEPEKEVAGGAQFDHSFYQDPVGEGCPQGPKGCPDGLSPEQSEYNALQAFFRGTPVANPFGGAGLIGTNPTPLYLQVFYQDVQYAQESTSCAVTITDPATNQTFSMSAQDLLNVAQGSLFGQSFPYPPQASGTCGNLPKRRE